MCTCPAARLLCSHISADAALSCAHSHTHLCYWHCPSHQLHSPRALVVRLPYRRLRRSTQKNCWQRHGPPLGPPRVCPQPRFISALTRLPCHRAAVTRSPVQSPTKLDRLPKTCVAASLLAPMTPCMELQSYDIVSMDKTILSSYTDQ